MLYMQRWLSAAIMHTNTCNNTCNTVENTEHKYYALIS